MFGHHATLTITLALTLVILATAIAATSASASADTGNPFADKQTPADNDNHEYMSRLLSKATPTANSQLHLRNNRRRRLANGDANFDDDGDGIGNFFGNDIDISYEIDGIDLTGYSLRFEKCQSLKVLKERDMPEVQNNLIVQRFIIFRLCPSNSDTYTDTDSDSKLCKCNSGFGEYMIDLKTYLDYTVRYRQEEQDNVCMACGEQCGDGDGRKRKLKRNRKLAAPSPAEKIRRKRKLGNADVDCDTCMGTCEKTDGSEENNSVDATQFIHCRMIQEANSDYDEDDNGNQQKQQLQRDAMYAGPICSSSGKKIKIGVFKDENCMFIDPSKNVEDYITNEDGNGMHLSHSLLKSVYNQYDCISCAKQVETKMEMKAGKNPAGATQVKDVCAQLYNISGKCDYYGSMDMSYTNNYGSMDMSYINNFGSMDMSYDGSMDMSYINNINNFGSMDMSYDGSMDMSYINNFGSMDMYYDGSMDMDDYGSMDMEYINANAQNDAQNDATSTNTRRRRIANNEEHLVCDTISSIQSGNYGEYVIGAQDYGETAIGSTYFSYRETDIDTGFDTGFEDDDNIIGSQDGENITGNEDGENAIGMIFDIDSAGGATTTAGGHKYALPFFISLGTYINLL